ncbi:hypothetical protein CsSME_00028773 [Camellia sinensis var. sinensis]
MSLKLGILNTRRGLMFKPSLDEQTLELQVKTSIGAEAISQQRLASAEAEITDLRQKLEASKREKSGLSGIHKSKHEENEAYISEIEVNEVGSVTKSIEAMKISKCAGSSIADLPTGLDTISTDLGAALVNLETGVQSWVFRCKSNVLSLQLDHLVRNFLERYKIWSKN